MEVHVTIRYWLLGAVCVLVMAAASWSVLCYHELSIQSCLECGGFRGSSDEFGMFVPCARCGGSGTRAVAREMGEQLFETILNARRALWWNMSEHPGDAAVLILGLAALFGIGLLVRVTDCRRCRGSGRRWRRECAACAGRGRATLADQML
jgi:hypothetical protein